MDLRISPRRALVLGLAVVLLYACGRTDDAPSPSSVQQHPAADCPIVPPEARPTPAALDHEPTLLTGITLFFFEPAEQVGKDDIERVPAAVHDAVPCVRAQTCVLSQHPTLYSRAHEAAVLESGSLRIEVTSSKAADGVFLDFKAADRSMDRFLQREGVVRSDALIHLGAMAKDGGPEIYAVATLGETTEALRVALAPWQRS